MVSAYRPRADGVLFADLPRECPASAGSTCTCVVRLDHTRRRKTGLPGLAVARCRVHDIAFTLYPPGQVPYGRVPVAEVAPDGSEIRRASRTDGLPVAEVAPASPAVSDLRPVRDAFARTDFVASADAATGKFWPGACVLDHDPCEGVVATQRRRVERQLALLGLDPAVARPVRDQIREVLGLDGVVVAAAVRVLGCAPASLRRRGEAICRLLLELGNPKRLATRLAITGRLVGRWGRPFCWDGAARVLRPLGDQFSPPGTPAPRPPP